MCGKYDKFDNDKPDDVGSPPHVREVLLVMNFSMFSLRITPACAGSTTSKETILFVNEDHPRMCGKYLVCFLVLHEYTGSPPHVREVLCMFLIYS